MMSLPIQFVIISLLSSSVMSKGPPRVVSEVTQRQIARVGDTVRLSCPVEADPPPLLQWSKDGESIHRGWERFKIMSLALRIKNTETEDTGKYECKATNGFGHVTVDYILIVLHANQSVPPPELDNFPSADDLPHFTKPEQMEPSLLIRPVGSSIRLSCDALGFPLPAIDWYKDGQKIDTAVLDDHMESGKWRFGSSNNGGNSEDGSKADSDMWSLPLVSLQEEDSGEYKCVVSNGHGEISHTYTLTVIEESKAKPILVPPNPRNMTVRYGEMASFMCEVHSIDQPHIQWLKRLDGTSTSQSDSTIRVNGQEFVVLQTGEVLSRQDGSFLNKLTINHATEEDSGMYICLGANTKGYTIRSAYLTVLPESVYSSGMDAIPQETSSFWDNRALPIIIGIPAGIILVIITIAVCIIKRKQGRAVARPPNQPTVRVQHYPPQSHVYGQTPSEKVFDHQYAALHPQYPVDATSQDRIIKTYSDKHSDSSYPSPPQTSGTPPVPSLAPTPTLVQQHTHLHYYQRT